LPAIGKTLFPLLEHLIFASEELHGEVLGMTTKAQTFFYLPALLTWIDKVGVLVCLLRENLAFCLLHQKSKVFAFEFQRVLMEIFEI
jgi:hypothetical protein